MEVVLPVPEVWWAERDWRACPGRMDFQERMAVKADRESRVMMGRLVLLANQVSGVKLAFQDSQEIRGPLDQRVSRVFEARVDLQGKEASEVEWDYQGHKETKDLKDNLVIQGNQVFQESWEFLGQGGLQETLGQRAYADQRGHRAKWAEEELLALWELLVLMEAQVLEEIRATVEKLDCKAQGGLLDLEDLLDLQVARASLYHLRRMVSCLWIHTLHSGLRISQ